MSVQNKLRDAERIRAESDELAAEFEAYARRFNEAVAARCEEYRAAAADRRAAAQEAFAGTREEYRSDLDRFADDIDRFHRDTAARREARAAFTEAFAADVATRRDAVERAQELFDRYSETFAAAITEQRDVSTFRDAVVGLAEEFAHHRNLTDEYVTAFREDVDRRRAAARATADNFAAYRETFLGETLAAAVAAYSDPDMGAATVAPADSPTGTDAGAAAGEVDDTTAAEPATDADLEVPSAETEGTDTPFSGLGEGTDPIDVESVAEEPEPVADADDGNKNDTTAAELHELNYGTLKSAANQLGYEENLNTATKADLVEFIAAKDPAEIEAAMEE